MTAKGVDATYSSGDKHSINEKLEHFVKLQEALEIKRSSISGVISEIVRVT
jgi:hypothetical protein